MRRVIYCPNNDFIEEASELSKKTFLPIQVGESSTTDSIDFCRESVCVVSIPQHNYATYKKNINLGFHQIIDYRNDFLVFDELLDVLINEEEISPTITEMHYAKFLYRSNLKGQMFADIRYDKQVLERIEFYVH